MGNINKHKDSYTYSVYYNTAIDILSKIEPYLVIMKKKLRAKFIIDNYKNVTIRNGRYNESQKIAKDQFYIDFMAL